MMRTRTFIVAVDVTSDRLPEHGTERADELRQELWTAVDGIALWLDGETSDAYVLSVASISGGDMDATEVGTL